MLKKRNVGAALSAFGMVLTIPVVAFAATTTVVTPANATAKGWSTADTRAGGHVSYIADSNAPLGDAALRLQTDSDGDPNLQKAQYMHGDSTDLSAVTDLSYATYQSAASSPAGDASYQLPIDINGTAEGGFTTLVYEPYWQNEGNPDTAPVEPQKWQTWDVDSGLFWSSNALVCSNGTLVKANTTPTPTLYTLSQLKTACPEAKVVGFGVNVGSYNAGYDIRVDALRFNDTTYDFELVEPQPVRASDKDDCKNNGWKNFQTHYKNQGDCVSSVVSNKDKDSSPSVADKIRNFFGL